MCSAIDQEWPVFREIADFFMYLRKMDEQECSIAWG
jgi:hypothetical protein